MTTTARQALSALIDDLVAPAQAQPLPAPRPQLTAVPAPPVAATAAPVLDLPTVMPQQRTAPTAYDVLPGGASNAILWRSRTA